LSIPAVYKKLEGGSLVDPELTEALRGSIQELVFAIKEKLREEHEENKRWLEMNGSA